MDLLLPGFRTSAGILIIGCSPDHPLSPLSPTVIEHAIRGDRGWSGGHSTIKHPAEVRNPGSHKFFLRLLQFDIHGSERLRRILLMTRARSWREHGSVQRLRPCSLRQG